MIYTNILNECFTLWIFQHRVYAMKAIKITFISALTEVNAYKLKRGYEWGVGEWKGLCIAMYSCPMDTRALWKRDWVAALSIIYFAIFLQATMKVCFFGDRQEEQSRAKHRYFGHTSNDARQKCLTRELCGWLTWLIATTRWSGLCVASIDEWQAKQ